MNNMGGKEGGESRHNNEKRLLKGWGCHQEFCLDVGLEEKRECLDVGLEEKRECLDVGLEKGERVGCLLGGEKGWLPRRQGEKGKNAYRFCQSGCRGCK